VETLNDFIAVRRHLRVCSGQFTVVQTRSPIIRQRIQTEEARWFPRKKRKRPAAVDGSGRNFAATYRLCEYLCEYQLSVAEWTHIAAKPVPLANQQSCARFPARPEAL
jgi:hypothetical protein